MLISANLLIIIPAFAQSERCRKFPKISVTSDKTANELFVGLLSRDVSKIFGFIAFLGSLHCTERMMLYVAVFLFGFLSFSKSDTPANCTFEEVAGNWIFYIGEGGHTNTLKCDDQFKVVREYGVRLMFPDIAVDQAGLVGFWTMIYNQGFEVHINGTKFFAFSKYEKSKAKVVSYCDQTLNGWCHDALYSQRNWACYYGQYLA